MTADRDDGCELPSPAGGELPIVHLTELALADGDGALWSLPHGGDLDANVVRLAPGHEIGRHVNDEVDVLIVVWHGEGQLVAGDDSIQLQPGVVVSVARGLERAIWASTNELIYVSIHRRRDPMTIRSRS